MSFSEYNGIYNIRRLLGSWFSIIGLHNLKYGLGETTKMAQSCTSLQLQEADLNIDGSKGK